MYTLKEFKLQMNSSKKKCRFRSFGQPEGLEAVRICYENNRQAPDAAFALISSLPMGCCCQSLAKLEGRMTKENDTITELCSGFQQLGGGACRQAFLKIRQICMDCHCYSKVCVLLHKCASSLNGAHLSFPVFEKMALVAFWTEFSSLGLARFSSVR